MRTRSRLKSVALPVGLATLAAILVGIYVVSYRNSVTHGAGLEKVLVASRDIPAGTDGSTIAAGGYIKTQTVPHRAIADGAIASATSLTSLVVASPIFKGQQITLRQFSPATQGGIFAKFSGNERVVVIPGDQNQLLAGTLAAGDHVDVVVTTRYHLGGLARSSSKVALRNLLVLKAPGAPKEATVTSGTPTASATLVMTDNQAETMSWMLRNGSWFLALRPTKQPRNSAARIETFYSLLARGMSPSAARSLIAGLYPESVDDASQ